MRKLRKPKDWPMTPLALTDEEKEAMKRLRELQAEFYNIPKVPENIDSLARVAKETLGIALNKDALVETRRKALGLLVEVLVSSPSFDEKLCEEFSQKVKALKSENFDDEVRRVQEAIEENLKKSRSQSRLDAF